jgi:hypothetical protein
LRAIYSMPFAETFTHLCLLKNGGALDLICIMQKNYSAIYKIKNIHLKTIRSKEIFLKQWYTSKFSSKALSMAYKVYFNNIQDIYQNAFNGFNKEPKDLYDLACLRS